MSSCYGGIRSLLKTHAYVIKCNKIHWNKQCFKPTLRHCIKLQVKSEKIIISIFHHSPALIQYEVLKWQMQN